MRRRKRRCDTSPSVHADTEATCAQNWWAGAPNDLDSGRPLVCEVCGGHAEEAAQQSVAVEAEAEGLVTQKTSIITFSCACCAAKNNISDALPLVCEICGSLHSEASELAHAPKQVRPCEPVRLKAAACCAREGGGGNAEGEVLGSSSSCVGGLDSRDTREKPLKWKQPCADLDTQKLVLPLPVPPPTSRLGSASPVKRPAGAAQQHEHTLQERTDVLAGRAGAEQASKAGDDADDEPGEEPSVAATLYTFSASLLESGGGCCLLSRASAAE